MFKLISKKQYSERVFCLEIEAPLIARSCKAGNFIIIRVDKNSERVPYTIAMSDADKGNLTLVVQEVGLSSTKLCRLEPGAYIEARWELHQKSRTTEPCFVLEAALE